MKERITMEDVDNEEWPSPQMKNIVHDLLPNEFPVKRELEKTLVNITGSLEASKLAEKYRPEIILQGINLKRERNSLSWGGMLYRVLKQKETEKSNPKAVIQYLYVWTRQKSFFSFWLDVVPLMVLVFLSLYINTDIIFYNPVYGTPTKTLPELGFVEELDRIIMISLISIGIITLGVITTLLRRKFYIHSTLHVLYGIASSIQIIELAYPIVPPISFQWTLAIPPFASDSLLITNILWTPLLLSSLSIVFLILLIFQIPLPIISSQHKMDYAPIYVYLKKNLENRWILDYILFDTVHYFVMKKTATELDKNKLLKSKDNKEKTASCLVINTSWHSMMASRFFWRFNESKALTWALKIFFWLGFFILIFTTIFPDFLMDFMGIIVPIEQRPFVQLFLRIVLPLLVILPLMFTAIIEPTQLYDRENLGKSNYILSDDKLLAFWNLETKKEKKPQMLQQHSKKMTEAQLKIVEKIQDPFNPEDIDKDFWETFYDMEFQRKDFQVKILRKLNRLKGSPHQHS
ncbi:MAG: hypothetical protein ACFE9L_11735 [Candidatus Hodarchaeota archaeon]